MKYRSNLIILGPSRWLIVPQERLSDYRVRLGWGLVSQNIRIEIGKNLNVVNNWGDKYHGYFPPEFWTHADGCFKGVTNVVAATFWENRKGNHKKKGANKMTEDAYSIILCKTSGT